MGTKACRVCGVVGSAGVYAQRLVYSDACALPTAGQQSSNIAAVHARICFSDSGVRRCCLAVVKRWWRAVRRGSVGVM